MREKKDPKRNDNLGIFICLPRIGRERASQVALVVKNPPTYAGDIRDTGSIPGLGRSPGGGHGNPLQYSCLENAMDRGASWTTVHGVRKSGHDPRRLSMRSREKHWQFPFGHADSEMQSGHPS